MAKSELTHNKALCYNCLYKLNEFDTKRNKCPQCGMKVDKDGFPQKGSSNYAWKKSNTGDKKVDEDINRNVALDQGFHFGTISRLRYGITEGNDDLMIINPDKTFAHNIDVNKLLIHRYRLTRHPLNISRTSSINLIRNSIKEIIRNSKHTPGILYIKLKKVKPNYPSHIILVEDKFLKARFGNVTGMNLLLNIIHTNNFFPVTSSLHRQTAIFKIVDNYEKTISESFLMPSSGLKVVERIPHNHLSLHEDESKLKSEVEDSLKFINMQDIHQYIPTIAKKSNISYGESSDEDDKSEDIIEDDEDDKASQMSDISIQSDGEITSKTVKSKLKPPKVSLGHLGIKAPSDSDYESVADVKEEVISLKTIESNEPEFKKESESTEETDSQKSDKHKKAMLKHLGVDTSSQNKSRSSHKPVSPKKYEDEEDDESGTGSHIGVDYLVEDDRIQESPRKFEDEEDESGTGSQIGVDYLVEDDRISKSPRKSEDEEDHNESKASESKTPKKYQDDEDDEDESGTGSHIGVDYMDENKDPYSIRSNEHESTDENDFTGDRIGVDFLGMSDYEDNISNDNQDNYEDDQSNDEKSHDETGDKVGVDFLSELEELLSDDNKSEESNISEKGIFKSDMEDLEDYPTAMHNFWGEFNKSRKNTTKTSWDGDEDDHSDEELDIPTQSDRENKDTKNKKLKIKSTPPKKKRTVKKKPKKNTKSTEDESNESPEKRTVKKKPKKTSKDNSDRDSKGRFISKKKENRKTKSSNKSKSKKSPPKKKSKKKTDIKSRDSKGRFKSSSKKKSKTRKSDKRSRDSKGRFKKMR